MAEVEEETNSSIPPPQPPAPRQSILYRIIHFISLVVALHFVISRGQGIVRRFFGDKVRVAVSKTREANNRFNPLQVESNGSVASGPYTSHTANLWKDNVSIDIFVFLSGSSDDFTDFDNEEKLVWKQSELRYSFDYERSTNMTIVPPEMLFKNGSVWAHVYVTMKGHSPNPLDETFEPRKRVYGKRQMNVHLTRKVPKKVRNLLSEKNVEQEEENDFVIDNYWRPSLDIRLIHDFTTWPVAALPKVILKEMKFDPSPKRTGRFFPPLYFDDMFEMTSSFQMLTNGVEESSTSVQKKLPLEISFSHMSMLRWQVQSQMRENWKRQTESGLTTRHDFDEMKRMLKETNPWLLGLTGTVTVVHMLFDCLAFKNEVQFWRKAKSMRGLSLYSIGTKIFFQGVILLYLIDNDASRMIIFSSAIAILIECWKLTKAGRIISCSSFPFVQFEGDDLYNKSATKQYDEIAMKHLMYVMYPLVIGYSIYSLVHRQHASWYSWFLSSLVSFIYMFGFIMMTPQLWINYKLKSVAHLPWRALVYKSLNTFIDDLFAFIIKMPTMHRLSCFRDDIIFFIFLYQRYIYPVDHERRNEYGQKGKSEKKHK
eukprot:g2373.t1